MRNYTDEYMVLIKAIENVDMRKPLTGANCTHL